MNFLRESLLTAWASLMVLISRINAFDDTERVDTFDLNIGFDLTSNSDGVPSLKLRRFEGKESAGRVAGNKGSNTFRQDPKLSEQDDSFESDTDDNSKVKKRVQIAGAVNNEDTSSDYDGGIRSTKGLRGEYEPEDNPKGHFAPSDDDVEEDSD